MFNYKQDKLASVANEESWWLICISLPSICHRWNWHHKTLSTSLPASYRWSDWLLTVAISLGNRRVRQNGRTFEIPQQRFHRRNMRRAHLFIFSPSLSALKLPKPHLLCGHLKFIKCYSMITFTRTAFDLLSLNYHKAVQRRASHCLFFCATVIAFLILCG